jgi:hypothetical protein
MPDDEDKNPQLESSDTEDQIALQRASAEATVILLAGAAVVFTPIVWIIASTAAAFSGVELKLDDRILVCSLGAVGAIITYGFGKGVVSSIKKGLQ